MKESALDPKARAKEIYFSYLNAGKGMTSEHLAQVCSHIHVNGIIEELNHNGAFNRTKIYWVEVVDEFKIMFNEK